MPTQIQSTIAVLPVRSSHPTYGPRRSFGAHLAALLLAAVAVQTACDPQIDDATQLADADAPADSILVDAIPDLEAAFAEVDPDEQDSELEADLRLCAEESAHGPSSCAKEALAAHSETRTNESQFDFTDEIEWVEPEREFSDGVAPRAACWGEVKVFCYGHECCGTSGGCATFCGKMKPPQQLPKPH